MIVRLFNKDVITMPITRATPTENFTIFSNDFIASTMPSVAYKVLCYLLSKPKNWHPKKHDIQKTLGLSAYAVKKALRWLCSAGYAVWVRLKTGHTIWHVFGTAVQPDTAPIIATSQAISPQVEKPQVAFRPDLQILETEEINKQQPTAPLTVKTAPSLPVVVFSENENVPPENESLVYPEQLKPEQKKAIKSIIKKAPIDMQQAILTALAYALLTNGSNIKSVPGYCRALVNAAINGTFTSVQDAAAPRTENPDISRTQELLAGYRRISKPSPDVVKSALSAMRAALKGSC